MAAAAESHLDLTGTPVGLTALVVFILAYLVVVAEEFTELRKSKPMVLGAGIIWALIAWRYQAEGGTALVEETARQTFLEYAELGLFLLVAMTYINSIDERGVFVALRSWLVSRRFTYRAMFWVTGTIAFFVSPIADNLTTALLMCAVVLAVGSGVRRFVQLAAINVVVAANAGGAFSPFGDITTLMVWQKGVVDFWTFFVLFLPAFVNFFVPAFIMSLYVPDGAPEAGGESFGMQRGAKTIMGLFIATIGTAVAFHHFFGLPPVLGMLTGLSYLQLYGFYLRKTAHRDGVRRDADG
ncbi:MAG: sodium:proton antiporter NhaD, partial [Gammaproteobacteria bacterium]